MKSRSATEYRFNGRTTSTGLLLVFTVSVGTLGLGFSANANERKTAIVTFDVPGAGTGAGQGTIGYAITPNETITGQYTDSGTVAHGYVRAPDGTFITFDAPGAGTELPTKAPCLLASTQQG